MNKEFEDAYLKSLKLIIKECEDDVEAAHVRADDLLCAALKDLGFCKLTAAFKRTERRYA